MCDFSVELLRQSPSPALRACCELAQVCGGGEGGEGRLAGSGGRDSQLRRRDICPQFGIQRLPRHPQFGIQFTLSVYCSPYIYQPACTAVLPPFIVPPLAPSLPPPQLHPTMARELFAPGFVSCWSELDGHLQQQLVRRWELQGSYRYRGSWPETPAVAGQKVGVA